LAPAARHQEYRVRQVAVQKSGEDVFDLAANKPDHLHAHRGQSRLERGRDRPTDQDVRAKTSQVGGPAECIRPGQPHFLAPQFPSVVEIHQQQAAGNIEDGRYPALPVRNRDPHRYSEVHGPCQSARLGKHGTSFRGFVQNAILASHGMAEYTSGQSRFQPFVEWHCSCSRLFFKEKEHS
jgi:hypothetical protein